MKTNSDTTPALYIGLDVHKEKTSVAIADPGAKGEIRLHGEVATTQIALERMIRKYLPKGMCLNHLTQAQCDRIAHKLNTRTPKRYGYRTPEELFN